MEELKKLEEYAVKPAASICPACTNPVYKAEAFIASDRTPFRKACVKCRRCKKMLSALTINEHRDQLYCKQCYHMVFMEKVFAIMKKINVIPNVKDYLEYTCLDFGGIVTPEGIERKEEEERKNLEKAERAQNEKKCPECEKKVFIILFFNII